MDAVDSESGGLGSFEGSCGTHSSSSGTIEIDDRADPRVSTNNSKRSFGIKGLAALDMNCSNGSNELAGSQSSKTLDGSEGCMDGDLDSTGSGDRKLFESTC